MSDMTSGMKAIQDSYTVRDLNRRTAEVLRAAGELGSVTIQSRGGGRFVLKAEAMESATPQALRFADRWSEQRERMKSLGFQMPDAKGWERLDQIIAGEE